MRTVRTWWRRIGVLAAVTVVAVTSAAVPATAAGGGPLRGCTLWERAVYAITASGGLVQYNYCLEPDRAISRWDPPTVVAETGWADTSTAFWSGDFHDTGVFYRVSASSGQLFWSGGVTSSWLRVGSAVKDWRVFKSLMSPAPGVIYALATSGVVQRYTHLGWQNGVDRFSGPVPMAGSFSGSKLLGKTDEGVFGLVAGPSGPAAATWPPSPAPGVEIAIPPSVVAEEVVPFQFGEFRTAAFGLTNTGELGVLLPVSCLPASRVWYVESTVGSGYQQIFAGEYIKPVGAGPVEWQCEDL